MKKSLIALAALGAFAGAASAQSSVTLFGIVDVGARAVRNDGVGTVKSLTSNGLATSRVGLRGVEDLGGGLNAGFWLEGELGADTGTMGTPVSATSNGKFFNRRSTVSLFGNFGEIRLGRDYVPTFSNLAAFDVYGAVGIGNILNLITNSGAGNLGSGAGTTYRADNAISYFLPAGMGGVYGTVMAAAGEGTTATNGYNRYVGGRVGFANGPFDVAAAYGRTKIPASSDLKHWNIGGSLNFGVAKVMALYHRGEFDPAGAEGQRQQRVWSIGGSVPVGAGEIRATYARSDMKGGSTIGFRDQDDARQYAIGYVHNLSKRTAVYADVGRLANRGNSALTIPGGTTNDTFLAGGRDSTAAGIGIRHSF